jgi:hypothetical protein
MNILLITQYKNLDSKTEVREFDYIGYGLID